MKYTEIYIHVHYFHFNRPSDVIIYVFSNTVGAASIAKRAVASVSVSFYVKSPLNSYNLALTSAELEDAVRSKDEQLEELLGYGVSVDDGPTIEEKEHLIEPWVTSLIVVAAVSILVALFVAYVSHQNK